MGDVRSTFAVTTATDMFSITNGVLPCMVVRPCVVVSISRADASVSSGRSVPIGLDDIAFYAAPFLIGSSLVVPSHVVLKDVPPSSMAMYASCSDSSLALFRRLLIVVIIDRPISSVRVSHGMVSPYDYLFVTI